MGVTRVFKHICGKLLEDNMQLYLVDLENEIMYIVDENFLGSYDYVLPKGENISKWCAKHCRNCVHEDDRESFINLLNPYELFQELKKHNADSTKLSLYFRNKNEEWRYISIQNFEKQYAILKIEKVEISDLAARVLAASRTKPQPGARIKSAKEFHALEQEFQKFPPASIGLVYIKSKDNEALCRNKDILADIFHQDNCYMLNDEVLLAVMADESSTDFQHNIIDLYSQLEDELQNDIQVGSHWTCDEDEENPFILLDKAIHKIIHG